MKKRMKRVCMIVYATYPLGETRVQREAEALLRNGYEVDVISIRLPDDLPVDHYKGVRIFQEKYRFPILGSNKAGIRGKFFNYLVFFISAAFRVTQLHLKQRYDVIQVHNLPDFLIFSAWIPKLMGARLILDLHDLMPEFFAGRFKSRMPNLLKLIEWQERQACKFADHVITVSEHWRQALIKRGVPENKCSVIMNVADDRIFHPCEHRLNKPAPNGRFRLIYHGSIHDRYGLDTAVEAVDRLRTDIPNIQLTLIGNGSYLAHIRKMVEDRKLGEYVKIDGLHLAEELPAIIRSHDLGVVPYLNDVFTDGLLPTKLMEYAALGLPAVASRTTAIEAYFRNTMTDFFEPGSAEDLSKRIRYLHDHPDRLEELSQGCQKFNEHYNWPKVSAAYVKLVDGLTREN
jgi:glycosyltransferase involved in cell wall biosynthesis